jgi:hypothetical protein
MKLLETGQEISPAKQGNNKATTAALLKQQKDYNRTKKLHNKLVNSAKFKHN